MQAAMVDPVLDFEVPKVVTGDLVGLTLAHAVIRSSQSA
jgi:ligand-binding sensor protein